MCVGYFVCGVCLYSKTCVRQPPLKLSLVVDVERWLSYKGTCHVILLAKLHDMYLYKTDNFFHINHYLKSASKVAVLHRFYCICLFLISLSFGTSGFVFQLYFLIEANCHNIKPFRMKSNVLQQTACITNPKWLIPLCV